MRARVALALMVSSEWVRAAGWLAGVSHQSMVTFDGVLLVCGLSPPTTAMPRGRRRLLDGKGR